MEQPKGLPPPQKAKCESKVSQKRVPEKCPEKFPKKSVEKQPVSLLPSPVAKVRVKASVCWKKSFSENNQLR